MDYLLTYFAVLVIGIELVLMTYGYLANSRALANRIFALYMLALVGGACGILLLVTAPTFQMAAIGAWLHTLAVFSATPLLAFLLLVLFVPNVRFRRAFVWIMSSVWLFSLLLLILDLFVPANLVFDFTEAAYVGGYVPLAAYLTGWFGPLFYTLFVRYTHILFPVFIVGVLVANLVAPERRVLAWRLLAALLVAYIVNGLIWLRVPQLSALAGSLSVAFIAVWAILRYRVLLPVSVGMRQALDTAVFGICVFDKQWNLLESNQVARQMLSIDGDADHTLYTLLNGLAETAVNRDGIETFLQETAVIVPQNRLLGIILPGAVPATSPTWLYLQFSPIYEDNTLLGTLCTIEDQTAMRQFQTQLEAAHHSLEQFAYQATLLNDIISTGVSGLDIKMMAERFADRLGDLFIAEGCYITFWDNDRKQPIPIAAYGRMQESYPTLHPAPDQPTLTQKVVESGKPLVIQNIAHSPYATYTQYEIFKGTSLLALPLLAGEEKLGAIIVLFDEDRHISDDEIVLAEQAANHIALAIAKEQSFQAEREQRELAETLREIGLMLTATLDYEMLLDTVLELIQRIVPYDTANVTLLEKGEIRIARSHGYEAYTHLSSEMFAVKLFSLDETPTFRTIVETGEALCLSDARQYEGWVVTEATRHVYSWIGVPLLIAGEVVAFLSVDKTEAGYYQEHHKKRLTALAYQVALALQQAQLLADSQRQAQHLALLNDLATQMAGLLTVQELTDLVVKRICADFVYDNVVIFMVDPEDEKYIYLQSVYGIYAHLLDGRDTRQLVESGIIGQAIFAGESVLENNTAANPHFFQLPEMNTLSELVVPIKMGQTVLGVLNIDSCRLYAFDQVDVALLTNVADQLAVAIQKARLFSQTDQRARELEVLGIISAALRAAHSVNDMLPIVLENSVNAIDASVGVIYLLDQTGNHVISKAAYPPDGYPLGLSHRLGQGITGHVAATRKMHIATDLQADPHLHRHESENEYLAALHTSIAMPLQTDQAIVGVIHIGMADFHQFNEFEKQLLTSIADIAANALYRAQVTESLEERVAERTQELQKAYVRLQELDRLKSKFISDVTHELRTPVANLNLYLDLLRMGRPEKKPHYMQVIESQTARLTQIVEQTMQVPEVDVLLESGDFGLVAMGRVAETAVHPSLARAQTAGLHLQLTIEPGLPPVRGDAMQLEKVIHYLLSNALNYTQSGSILVVVSANTVERLVCLQVEDTGMGIAAEELPYVFDRFYRGRQVGQLTIPGVGLGLSLAKEIVEQHNGRIHIQSTLNEGTICTVCLPFADSV